VTKKLNASQVAEAVARYASGESTANIADCFGVSTVAISNLARRRGVVRTRSMAQKRVSYDPFAFRRDDAESRYWTGFMMADGCIVHRAGRMPTLALVVSDVDREHLERFRAFLRSDHAITKIAKRPNSNASVRFALTCERLCADLAALGVRQRKSATAKAPDHLVMDRDFWRGVVDGDGSIGRYRAGAMLRLVGSQDIVTQFLEFARTHVPTQASVRPHKSIFTTGIVGRIAEHLASVLYQSSDVALARKANAALNVRAKALVNAPEVSERLRHRTAA